MICKIRYFIIIPLIFLFINGCAFVNLSLLSGPQALKEQELEGRGTPKILIIDVTGMISEKDQEQIIMGSTKPSMVAQIHEALQKAESETNLAGLIIRINSPGGTASAADIIHHDIVRFKAMRRVPIYACITGVGASGGYYVATAADDITAHPTAVTGSIGVILMAVNVEGLMQKIGVNELTIKSGDKKDLLSPFRTATPEEKQLVQTVVNQMHRRFVDVVMSRPGNTLKREELEKLADGRIYTSEQALSAKLIDRVGYLDDVITRMKENLGIKEAKIITYYRPGQYKGTIYTNSPVPSSRLAGFLAGNAGLDALGETTFMYLWRPF